MPTSYGFCVKYSVGLWLKGINLSLGCESQVQLVPYYSFNSLNCSVMHFK